MQQLRFDSTIHENEAKNKEDSPNFLEVKLKTWIYGTALLCDHVYNFFHQVRKCNGLAWTI